MQYLRFLAGQTLFQVAAKVTSSGASFLLTILIARLFNVAGYGDFAKVTAFVSLFYLLVDFGLNAMFLQQEKHETQLRSLLSLRLVVAGILFFVTNGIALSLPYSSAFGIGFSPEVKFGIFLFSFTFFGQAIIFTTSVMFQKAGRYQNLFFSTLVGSLITIILAMFAGLIHAQLPIFLLAYVIGAFVQGGVSLLFIEWEKAGQIDKNFIKTLVQQTIPIALLLIFNLVYFRIDMLILALYKPSADVAFYDISYRVFDFLIALPLFLSNVLYPRLIETQKNLRKVNANEWFHIGGFALIGCIIAVVFWFVAPIIFFLIKPQLLPATLPMHILLLSLPFFFVTSILQWILLARRQQILLSWVYGGFMLFNIILNLVFIPQYSYVASAIITGVSELLVLIILLLKLL